MKLKTRRESVFIFCCLMILSNCGSDVFNSETKRRHPGIEVPLPTVDAEASDTIPELNLSQELKNCAQSEGCEQQDFQTTSLDPYAINSLIVADSDRFTNTNVSSAPSLKFEINNIDKSLVQSVAYSYSKKDILGNIIIQTDFYNLYEQDEYYSVPIHSNKMGNGVLVSAPFESHIIKVKVIFNQNKTYTQELKFFLQTSTANPVTIIRNDSITDSSYYKMDMVQASNVIDSVTLKNTLPYEVELSGNIELNNKTLAFLNKNSKIQHRQFRVCSNSNYSNPCDYYEHTYTNEQDYEGATTSPLYSLRILRGNTYIEIPTSPSMIGEQVILDFNELGLFANEEINLELIANFNLNNSIIGDHGNINIFAGTSYCEDPSSMDCYCFYQVRQTVGYLWFISGVSFLESIRGSIYPACNTNHTGFTAVDQNLSVNQYPEYSIDLIGRAHSTSTKYTVTAWLSGFNPSNNFGTLTKTMDPLESTTGFIDESAIANSINYDGFIPGEL